MNTSHVNLNDVLTNERPLVNLNFDNIDYLDDFDDFDNLNDFDVFQETFQANTTFQNGLTIGEDMEGETIQASSGRLSSRGDELTPDRSRQRSFLIQWNPNGFYAHYEEFAMLATDLKPYLFCVQETLLKSGQALKLKGFQSFTREVPLLPGERVRGGVGILVSDDCLCERIEVQQNI